MQCIRTGYLHIRILNYVESVKVEFDWVHPSVDENYGHTQSEWGKSIPNTKKVPFVIYAYKMKWELMD